MYSKEDRLLILREYNADERFCTEQEKTKMTTVSRTQSFLLEKTGDFPKRIKISNKVVWLYSELLLWIQACEQQGR